jgi:hypothetical protein
LAKKSNINDNRSELHLQIKTTINEQRHKSHSKRKDLINEKRHELHSEIKESINKKDVIYVQKNQTPLMKKYMNIEVKPIIQKNKINKQFYFHL